MLVYVRGSGGVTQRSIAWVDRQGRQEPVRGIAPGEYRSVSVGPGGRQIALEDAADSGGRIWTYDVARATRNVLTSGGDDRNPIWSADGKRIVFSSRRDGTPGLFSINADGTGAVIRIATVPDATDVWPHSWSHDGTLLAVAQTTKTSADIVAVTADGKVSTMFGTALIESHPAISPNNEWLGYVAVRDGGPDVFVERYPALGDRRTLPRDPGILPLWARDNRELFYFDPGRREMMSVAVTGGTFASPTTLFTVPMYQLTGWRTYDVMPDGRFVMILRSGDGQTASPTPIVAQNWGETLKRVVPVK
jgi:Tol biopolymer transport system component